MDADVDLVVEQRGDPAEGVVDAADDHHGPRRRR
jgi:hypothetical protein